jgi:hypothetical protein
MAMRNSGETEKVTAVYMDELHSKESRLGTSHPDLVPGKFIALINLLALQYLADVYLNSSDSRDKAIPILTRAIEILELNNSDAHLIVEQMRTLGNLYQVDTTLC